MTDTPTGPIPGPAVDPDADVRRLVAEAAGNDEAPTHWFERLYAAAADGEAVVPWDRKAPHWMLSEWARARGLEGAGRSAVVVGAGMGEDAEYLAGLGFDTTAFDVAPSAVAAARDRFPGSAVRYTTGDLLDLPPQWLRSFSLVFESMTVQALPPDYRDRATAGVRELLAPGGTLLVISAVRERGRVPGGPQDGPPWPLSRAEVDAFAADGLRAVRVEEVTDPERPEVHRWRAEFTRPPGEPGAAGAVPG